MSSRQQEKERRRQERQAAEEAATRSASRKRKLQIGGAAVLLLAVIAVVAVVALAGGGGDDAPETAGFAADARAAGCTFNSYRAEGRDHTSEKVTSYKTNPPTSGPHNPVPAQDGIYQPGNEPAPENWVHSLEHGRVLYQYKPGTPAADVAKLRSLAEEEFNDSPGYHTLMFQNNTKMTPQFALVSWTKSLTCDKLTPEAEDVMRQFREQYTDKAPEFIP